MPSRQFLFVAFEATAYVMYPASFHGLRNVKRPTSVFIATVLNESAVL